MFKLKHSSDIEIEDFPLQWLTITSCLDPELPGFALHYIHFLSKTNAEKDKRVFGCPIQISLAEITGSGSCTARVKVICNIDLDSDLLAYQKFKMELCHRFGITEKLGIQDLHACSHNQDWKDIIDLIFPRIKTYYGDYIPYGQFYSELFGIFRFAASWNTTAGRKQEMIMLSNLLSRCGEEVENQTEFPGINFSLLPTYGEVLDNQLSDFPSFQSARDSIIEMGDAYLTKAFALPNGTFLFTGADTNPSSKSDWDDFMSIHNFSQSTVEFLTGVREDMNRMNMRPFVFFTHMYSLFKGCDYYDWTKIDYVNLYNAEKSGKARGSYPKVIACFLQQSFLKTEIMPVDTWMNAFFSELLLHGKNEIPKLGRDLGKFERFVWATVQLRKNNQPRFNDILFCIKTGGLHSSTIIDRQPNPLSCGICTFEAACPTRERAVANKRYYAVSRHSKQAVKTADTIELVTSAMGSGNEAKKIKDYASGIYPKPAKPVDFIILLEDDDTPFGVYLPSNKAKDKWKLTDNMSPMTIHNKFRRNHVYRSN